MISVRPVKKCCFKEILNIENYDKAVNDANQT